MNIRLLFMMIGMFALLSSSAQTVLLTEDFETDGEGSRYTSSTFSNCTNNDYFLRTNLNPYVCSTAGFGNALTNVQGSYFWVSEDIESVDNPNGTFATLTLNPVNVSGYTNISVSAFLAEGRADGMRWETDDKVEIQVSWDGGSYQTIGRFVGDNAFGGYLREDTNLDGLADGGASTVGLAFTNFTYSVLGGGTNLSVRIYLNAHDGTEELAFDQIIVRGDVGTPANYAPVLASIESSAIVFTEGDSPVTVSSTITVSDLDDTSLDSAFVEICTGFNPAEDVLSYSAVGGIVGSFDPLSGVLKLTGNSSLANYQTVLRSVQYQNINTTNPSNSYREICFSVHDGTDESNVQKRRITIMDVITELVCLPFGESFEQDGEGITYVSNTFDDSPNPDFFLRTNTQPGDHAESVSGIDGSYFWASEDVIGTATGNNPGVIEFAPLNIAGNSNYTFNILMGTSNHNGLRWEQTDNIILQYNIDGAGWNTFGLFQGDDPFGGDLRLDLDNDTDTVGGGGPYGDIVPNGSVDDFEFTFSGTGSEMKIRIVVEQDGGSEELVFDNIRISGDVSSSLSCSDTTVYLDNAGDVSIAPEYLTDVSTANCGVDSVLLDFYDFTCGELGDNTVTVTVYHSNTTTSTCSSIVTVVDTVAPQAICQDVAVFLDSFGATTIDSLTLNGGSSDNCSITMFSVDSTTFDCSEIGTNTVVLTVEDGSGNSALCSATVTVYDTIAPVAITTDTTVYLDVSGLAAVDSSFVNNGSSDVCGIATIAIDKSSFDCNEVGPNSITMTVTDVNGNSSVAMAVVTVKDTIAPNVIAHDTTLYLDSNGVAVLAAAEVDAGSIDNCSIDSMYLSQDTFDCSDIGMIAPPVALMEKSATLAPPMGVTVELTVVDENGNSNSDWFNVSVVDTVSPIAMCHDTLIYLDEWGVASLAPAMIDDGSYDNCSAVMLGVDSSNFDCSEIGANAVTLTVLDMYGNTAMCSASVTVVDTFAPVALCADTTVYLDGDGMVSIESGFIDDGSSDACGIDSLALDITSFTCDNIGVNLVELSVFDPSGNRNTCSANVTVVDTIPPTVICKNLAINLGESLSIEIQPEDLDNGSSDACGIASYALSKTVFTGVDVGVNLVELTVTDIHGNSAVCTSTVTVQDTIAPELWCQNVGVTLDEQGETRIYAAFLLDSVYDAGGIASYTVDIDKMDCSHVGKNIVTLSVKDYGGNVTTCTAQVTINDLFAPSVACRDFAVALNAEGFAEVPADSIDAGSSDACGIAGMELSQTVFTASDLGENTVTLYVSDVNGNTDSCQAVVRVTDNIAPVVNCNPLEVWVSDENDYELSPADLAELAAGSLDNATEFDSLTIGVSPSVFSCSQAGDSVTVEVMVTDESGNESSCETKVYVSYLLAAELEDIEVTLDSGQCETRVDYPEFFANGCATFTLVDGLGADGLFPVGSTVESWEVVAGTQVDTVTFAVIVEAPNQVPTLDATADTTVAEDQVPELLLTGISAGNDCQAQALTVTASSITDGLLETIAVDYEAGSTTAALTLSFIANQSGEAEVVVTVEDEMGASITDTFVVTVSPENDAPELVKMIEDQQLQAEDELIVTLSKVLGEVFADADGDELSWTFMLAGDSIPAWMTTEETATEYVLDFTPMRADTGCYTIVVQVSDPAGATAQDSFELCVTSIPVAVVDFGESVFDVVMYPNPSKGMVRVELETSSGSATEVSVSNVAGAEVFRRSYLSGDAIQLDLSGHVSGMYLVRVAQDGNQVIRKLILDKQ
ncbi:T9SS type A sorting domain-containing protein [uncultured Draconibacterium sp.]|uniref:T9SS type A sorting domain-containing protein n=1 Tax=uncultured Draconibacterium sp. TaxID=1573823 RepID=UPI00325FF30E